MNLSKKFDYLIVGAGLFESTFAYEMTKAGKKCLIIESKDHIAGLANCDIINSNVFYITNHQDLTEDDNN
jgi:UDP-galactopyranose mutase